MSDTTIAEEESAGQFLARVGTSGQAWAAEFMKMHGGKTLTEGGDDCVDEHTLLSWFANAIEAGRSAGYWKAREELGHGLDVPPGPAVTAATG